MRDTKSIQIKYVLSIWDGDKIDKKKWKMNIFLINENKLMNG